MTKKTETPIDPTAIVLKAFEERTEKIAAACTRSKPGGLPTTAAEHLFRVALLETVRKGFEGLAEVIRKGLDDLDESIRGMG